MRIAVSSIAWPREELYRAICFLRTWGVDGMEVAPTSIWDSWAKAVDDAPSFRLRMQAADLAIPAMQAILYDKPGLELFGSPASRAALQRHLIQVAELGYRLGAGVAVLGAPKNRIKGELSFDEAIAQAAEVLTPVAHEYAKRGVRLCIEPNPVEYGCDFVTNAKEGVALVNAIGVPDGFGLHLDSAALHLAGESLDDPHFAGLVIPYARHYHISEPGLAGFRESVVPHANNAIALEQGGYAGWASIEMRQQPGVYPALALAISVAGQYR